jgi:hypothetical protein
LVESRGSRQLFGKDALEPFRSLNSSLKVANGLADLGVCPAVCCRRNIMEATARRDANLNQRSSVSPRQESPSPHFALISEPLAANAARSDTAARDAAPRSRRRRALPVENPLLAYKITLPESVHRRLRLAAIERGVSVSALTAQILDRHLQG